MSTLCNFSFQTPHNSRPVTVHSSLSAFYGHPATSRALTLPSALDTHHSVDISSVRAKSALPNGNHTFRRISTAIGPQQHSEEDKIKWVHALNSWVSERQVGYHKFTVKY